MQEVLNTKFMELLTLKYFLNIFTTPLYSLIWCQILPLCSHYSDTFQSSDCLVIKTDPRIGASSTCEMLLCTDCA